MSEPASPPPVGAKQRFEEWAWAPLTVCLALMVLQVALFLGPFVLSVAIRGGTVTFKIVTLASMLSVLMPLGALYGLYLSSRPAAQNHGCLPRVLGVCANALYLLFGIFCAWMLLTP